VRNCIIAGNAGYGLREAHTQGDFHIYNSCFTNNPTAHWRDENSANYTNAVGINSVSPNTNNIAAAPLFVAPAQGVFALEKLSPCIDAGTPTTDLLLDFYGKPRLKGAAVDIGSYEQQPPLGTLLVVR
jgi:hypothetical protein